VTQPSVIPPKPTQPPTVGTEPPIYTPTPIGGADPATPSLDEAAERFWAPAGRLLTDWWLKSGPEQVSTIAATVTGQVHTLLTETEAQRAAREQVAYDDLIDSHRAMRDAEFAARGETAEQRAERHRIENDLNRGRRTHRDDLVGLVDMLGARITETPDERAARQEGERELDKARARAEEDRWRAAAGETPEQRTKRHRVRALADKREAKTRKRRQRRRSARTKGTDDRTRRFRKWVLLTAISAYLGQVTGLVPVTALGGPYAGLLLAVFGWGLDLRVRDMGRQRVTEVARGLPTAILLAFRIPVASGLVIALQADGLLSALPHPLNPWSSK
jgi:hypothetical protein